jgi:hypothetical protein
VGESDEGIAADPLSQVQSTLTLSGDFGAVSSVGEVKLTLGITPNTGLALLTLVLLLKNGGMRERKDSLMLKRLEGRFDLVVLSRASSSGIELVAEYEC